VVVLIIFFYLGILIYLITQHRGMAERQAQRVEEAREDMRHFIGFGVVDEIEKLERLKHSGTISTTTTRGSALEPCNNQGRYNPLEGNRRKGGLRGAIRGHTGS
jgi:hypothetical protein